MIVNGLGDVYLSVFLDFTVKAQGRKDRNNNNVIRNTIPCCVIARSEERFVHERRGNLPADWMNEVQVMRVMKRFI
jgi:hypothetical protein